MVLFVQPGSTPTHFLSIGPRFSNNSLPCLPFLSSRNSERQVRVGISEAYDSLFQILGPAWVLENCRVIIHHLYSLASHPKTYSTPIEEVNARECLSFALKSAFEKNSTEEVQLKAMEEILAVLRVRAFFVSLFLSFSFSFRFLFVSFSFPFRFLFVFFRFPFLFCSLLKSIIDSSLYNQLYPPTGETIPVKQGLVVLLHELSDLIQILDKGIKGTEEQIVEVLKSLALHPSFSIRQATAWCFRVLALACPHLLPSLLSSIFRLCADSYSSINYEQPESISRFRVRLFLFSIFIFHFHFQFSFLSNLLSLVFNLGAFLLFMLPNCLHSTLPLTYFF